MEKKYPPRLWGAPDLLDEYREIGKWCAFEIKYNENDTEFLSKEEHDAIVKPLVEALEKIAKHEFVTVRFWNMANEALENYKKQTGEGK